VADVHTGLHPESRSLRFLSARDPCEKKYDLRAINELDIALKPIEQTWGGATREGKTGAIILLCSKEVGQPRWNAVGTSSCSCASTVVAFSQRFLSYFYLMIDDSVL
jgi:hypothetical protein